MKEDRSQHLSYLEYSSYSVDLYDMEIEDVQERAKKKLHFKTAKDAANFLGIVPNKFYDRIGVGKYAYHVETKHKYAVRKVAK